MSEGYYEPHARIALEEPLVLVGHPGSGVAHAARAISGRTGLPFNDVQRSAEARAGQSLARIAVERGIEALRGYELEALRRALRRRPCGIVATSSGPFEHDDVRAWILQAGRVLYVRRPVEVLLARIQLQLEASPGSLAEFVVGAPTRAEDLERHLAGRELALQDAHAVLEAGDRHASRLADEILEGLDRLLGVRRLD